MSDIILHRVASTADYTAGVVIIGGKPICVSLELPWLDNQRNISCIPAGKYRVDTQHESPSKGECWLIEDVPNRDHCLFHTANRTRELKGCVAPGMKYGELKSEFAVLQSRAAMVTMNFAVKERFNNLLVIDGFAIV